MEDEPAASRPEQKHLFEPPPKSPVPPKAPTKPVWTESKARLIREYLQRFILVTRNGHYIDGFAGPQDPANPDSWAARLALELQLLRHFHLFEKDRDQIARLETLRAAHSERDVQLYPGDFNERIHELLDSDAIGPRDAVFCLIDQRNVECRWATVERIATHRSEGYRFEQFYFLATSWLDRSLKSRKTDIAIEEVNAWWGGEEWLAFLDLSSFEQAGVFQERFRELGYRHAWAWPIYGRRASTSTRVMYYMVHASDHDRAPELMREAYGHSVRTEPTRTRAFPGV